MGSERAQRRVERLLDEADEAIGKLDWQTAMDRALAVLRLEPDNVDARIFLDAANRESSAGGDSVPNTIGPTPVPSMLHPDLGFESLVNIAKILVEPGELAEKLGRAMGELVRVSQVDTVTLWEVDESEHMLRLSASAGPFPANLRTLHIDSQESSISVEAYSSGLPVIANDYSKHPSATPTGVNKGVIKSLAAFPVIAGSRTLGVVSVVSRYLNHLTPNRVSLLTAMVDGLGTLLENARLQEVVRNSEERYRAVVDNILDAIVINQDGKRVFCNKAFLDLLGIEDMAEAIGQSDDLYIVPEDRKLVSERTAQRQLGAIVPSMYEYRVQRTDGYVRTVQTSAVATTFGGRPATLAVLRDVTESRRLEAQLIQSDKLAAVGTLVSGVAHEVNNPLTGALGLLQLLLRRDSTEETRAELQTIYDETNRAVRIMRNMLSFAREHKPELGVVSINELVEATVELRAYELRTHNVTVELELQAALPEIMADRYQLQQVLMNLIINAEQAMTGAGMKGTLTIGTRQKQDTLAITVGDNGPGIPAHIVDRIFEPFFTTKSAGEGTGLGLSIAYGIIQEHGGLLSVESKVGGGTTFTIDLPMVRESDDGT